MVCCKVLLTLKGILQSTGSDKLNCFSFRGLCQVRSAFFELISAFCQHLPEVVKAEAPRVCPAVLLSIDDSDAVVCLALWEAVLYTITTIEVTWEV